VDIFKPIDTSKMGYWKEVWNPWLPPWAYTNKELREIGKTCINFNSEGYTTKIFIVVTDYFDKDCDIL